MRKRLKATHFIVIAVLLVIVGSLVYYAFQVPPKTLHKPFENSIDPYLGPEDAPVTIVEFSDFQCSQCKTAVLPMEDIVTNRYLGKVKLVYRDFPVRSSHRHAQIAAEAAQSAFEQDRFWEYHDLLFERQSEWGKNDLNREKVQMLLIGYAVELGLDVDQFSKSLDEGKYTDEVENDRLDGLSYGVRGTPTFFVNGERIEGFNFSTITEAIEKALDVEASVTES